ncbi:MAG: hypothetical protein ABFS86_15445 [Planctomycetota bacterium]
MGHSKGRILGLALVVAVIAAVLAWGAAAAQEPKEGGTPEDLALLHVACDSIAEAATDFGEIAGLQEADGRTEAARETVEEQKALIGVLSRTAARLKKEADGLTKQAAALAETDPAKAKAMLDRWSQVTALQKRLEKKLAAAKPKPEEDEWGEADPPGADVPSRKWAKLGRSSSRAVRAGLGWLRDHQDEDGGWDCDNFMKHDKVPPVNDGAGQALYDPGISGLALLAFLGMDQTPTHGEHRTTMRKGLKYLKGIQAEDGCFGPMTDGHFTYNHAIATLAMVEAYGETGAPHLGQSAQLGVDFIRKAQNPYLAWRYGVRPQDNDTSVTGWMVSALFAAKRSGLRVSQETFDGARAWIEKATNPETGRVGYTARDTGPARPEGMLDRWPPDKSAALTAIGILTRVHCGEDPRKSAIIGKSAERCLKRLPVWDMSEGTIDHYYWYFGTRAMYEVGGRSWKKWQKAIVAAVIDHQRMDPVSYKGSWDPAGPWGASGGRVYSTALCTLLLETPVRTRILGSWK